MGEALSPGVEMETASFLRSTNGEENMLSPGTGLNTGDKVSHQQGQAGTQTVRRACCRKA